MRRAALLALLVVGLVAFVLATVGGDASAEDQSIAWETDLAAATTKAQETGRPLMVVFR